MHLKMARMFNLFSIFLIDFTLRHGYDIFDAFVSRTDEIFRIFDKIL